MRLEEDTRYYKKEDERITEEIIIDGVDVSECNFRLERDNQQKCECSHATGFGVICDCEKWHNCDFIQLKRKEQECEELKEQLDSVVREWEEYTELYKQVLDEIEEFCTVYSTNHDAYETVSKYIY